MIDNFNEYQYSPVRLKLGSTGEIFNIGVILMDQDGRNRHIKTIDSFKSIGKCLKIENPDSQDFILGKLHSSFSKDYFKFGENFSNSFFVESPEWLNSEKSLEEELETTFNEIVTISYATHHKNSIGEYSNTKIISKIENLAIKRNLKNIAFRKRSIAYKQIDAVTYGEKGSILTVGEVCSPHVDNFMDQFGSSLIAIDQLKNQIKAAILFFPMMEAISNTQNKNYNFALGLAKERGHEVIASKFNEEFLEAIISTTNRYGGDLFSELK